MSVAFWRVEARKAERGPSGRMTRARAMCYAGGRFAGMSTYKLDESRETMARAKGSFVGGRRARDSREGFWREEPDAVVEEVDDGAGVGRERRRPRARCWVARGPLRRAVLASLGAERRRA